MKKAKNKKVTAFVLVLILIAGSYFYYKKKMATKKENQTTSIARPPVVPIPQPVINIPHPSTSQAQTKALAQVPTTTSTPQKKDKRNKAKIDLPTPTAAQTPVPTTPAVVKPSFSPADQSSETADSDGSSTPKFLSVEFNYNSSDLTQKAKNRLKKTAKILLKNKSIILEAVGSADDYKTEKKNKNLARLRSKCVRDFLGELSVPWRQVQFKTQDEVKNFKPDSPRGVSLSVTSSK
jgi:outer membrane protein OmpA-like peptidoglycan-associated protein